MIDELKPYTEYKDTPSVWLGSVPTPWEVRSLRTLDEIRADILALEKESEGLLDEIIGGRRERDGK